MADADDSWIISLSVDGKAEILAYYFFPVVSAKLFDGDATAK